MNLIPKFLYIWLSKSALNFTGIANRMVQQGLWESAKYRCCMIENEIDTFHIRYWNNTLMIGRKIILNAVFNIVGRIEHSKDIKEMILYSLLE